MSGIDPTLLLKTIDGDLEALSWEVHFIKLKKFDASTSGSLEMEAKTFWKTVGRVLIPEQADLMKQAINNHHQLDALIDEFRLVSQKLIFALPWKSLSRSTAKHPKSPSS